MRFAYGGSMRWAQKGMFRAESRHRVKEKSISNNMSWHVVEGNLNDDGQVAFANQDNRTGKPLRRQLCWPATKWTGLLIFALFSQSSALQGAHAGLGQR